MFRRTTACLALITFSAPAFAAELISTVQPSPYEMPYCLKGDKIVCDFVLFDANDPAANGSLPLMRVGDQLPISSSVELRRLPVDPRKPGAAPYLLIFNYATPQTIPGAAPQASGSAG